jgi:hypothetical protein
MLKVYKQPMLVDLLQKIRSMKQRELAKDTRNVDIGGYRMAYIDAGVCELEIQKAHGGVEKPYRTTRQDV